MSDLLKEAIADAKAVRATALANAKAALEESFKPTLEAMLAEKLKNEIESEDEAVHSSDIGAGGAPSKGAVTNQDPGGTDHTEKVFEESEEEEVTSEELDEILAELEKEMGEEQAAPAPAPEAPVAAVEPAAEIPAPAPEAPVAPAPAPEAPVTAEEVEEINLQELLDTLSEEVEEIDEAKKEDSEEKEEDDKEEVKEEVKEIIKDETQEVK